MRTRQTTTVHHRWKAGEYYYPANPAYYPADYIIGQEGIPYVTDTCSDEVAPGPPYRVVNPLTILHMMNQYTSDPTHYGEHWVSGSGVWTRKYRGYYHTSLGTSNPVFYGDSDSVYNQSLDALGATGWSKFKPAKPIADVGVMLGESRELPRQFKDAVKALKALRDHPSKSVRSMSWLSNQHLATQFGWLPLMRDLQKCYNALKRSDEWLSRVRKENGKWVHRGGTVSSGGGQHTAGKAYISPPPTVNPPEGTPGGDIYVTWGYRVWFSAWFKYYIADFDSAMTQLRLKSRIWGLTNTPTIVWNLLPWSWLADWFSNLGDNIDNLVPIDGLVAKMPCIMRHCWTNTYVRVSQRYYASASGGFVTHSAECTKSIESKGRGVASPFGFGLSSADLSPRQLSILAALGITRAV